jgi:hypothetical protein
MKHTILKTWAMLGLLFMLAATSVHAQSATLEMNIPFDFTAGKAKLKAGTYKVERVKANMVVFTSINGDVRIFALAPTIIQRGRSDAPAKLVFHRYGDLYFLAEVWVSRDADGNVLYPSGAERRLARLARELAKTNSQPKTIEIVARAN